MTDEEGRSLDPEVAEFLAAARKFVTEYYGERCPDVSRGCCCCQAWMLYDTFENWITY